MFITKILKIMKCSVGGCKNESKFRFPSDEIIKKIWIERVRKNIEEIKDRHGLCPNHFVTVNFTHTPIQGE